MSIDLRTLVLRVSEIRKLWSSGSFTSLSRSQVQVVWPVICFVSFCTRPCWHSLITKIYSYSCTSSDLLDWIMCGCPWAVCHLPNTGAREVAAYARRSQESGTNGTYHVSRPLVVLTGEKHRKPGKYAMLLFVFFFILIYFSFVVS